jgi:hypothetical protein
MKMFGVFLLLCVSASLFAKDDLTSANYPLKAHVKETGVDKTGSHSSAPGTTMPMSGAGGQPTLQVERDFMSVAILKLSDGNTYYIHGEQVQFLKVDADYACRVSGKKNNKMEILGQDSKGHWHEWKATIDKQRPTAP